MRSTNSDAKSTARAGPHRALIHGRAARESLFFTCLVIAWAKAALEALNWASKDGDFEPHYSSVPHLRTPLTGVGKKVDVFE